MLTSRIDSRLADQVSSNPSTGWVCGGSQPGNWVKKNGKSFETLPPESSCQEER